MTCGRMADLTARQTEQLEALKQKTEEWYRDVLKRTPRLNDGNSMTLEFVGGMSGYGRADEEVFDFRVKETLDGLESF